jgi:hypothetical protein
VGTVYHGAHLVAAGNLSTHRGMSIQWRGMVDWCQPMQAEDLHDLAELVRHRLGMAGLKMAELNLRPMSACAGLRRDKAGAADYLEIICRVSRNGRGCERAKRVNRMIQTWAISTGGARSDADGSQ